MRPRELGHTKLKQDCICNYCKQVARHKGEHVQVVQDMDTQIQYIAIKCKSCGESYLTR